MFIRDAFFFPMTFYTITALINALVSLILGAVLLLEGFRKKLNITYALLAFSVAWWSIAYYFWQTATFAEDALYWARLLMVGASLIPFFYYHFVLILLREEHLRRLLLVAGYVFALVFAVLSGATDLIVASVVPKLSFAFWPEPGPLLIPFLSIWLFYFMYTSYLLLRGIKRSTGSERGTIELVFLGTTLGYIGGVTNYFLWFDIPISPYGNVLVSLYVILVAYAIARHRLFDIRIVFAELFTLAIWLFAFVRLLLSDGQREIIINAAFLAGVLGFGALVLKSVNKVVEQREQLQRLTTDLEKANSRLRELDQQKSEFVSIASHQLRSPLTSVMGYASMLAEGTFGKMPQGAKEALERIVESSRLMAASVEDFLNVSRIEQGRMKYDRTTFDVLKLIRTVYEEQKPIAAKKGLSLQVELPEEEILIFADLGKIKQVLTNLVDNAMKYTPRGRITMRALRTEPELLRIEVSDTGVGISQETLPTLFDKFVRSRNAHEVNVTGTGLGLYVAKEIVKAHHGKIWAESEGEDHGATFIIELAAKRPKAPQMA